MINTFAITGTSTASSYLFVGFFVLLLAFILFLAFTKKGRKLGPEITFGAKVVADFGEIANNPIALGNQKLRLLGCEKYGNNFFVLEVKTIAGPSVQVNWVKIDDATLATINHQVKTNR